MEKKEYLVQPKIATYIMELHLQHALPVDIIIGDMTEGFKSVTFKYEPIDYYLVAWLINKGNQFYTGLPYEEIMDVDD